MAYLLGKSLVSLRAEAVMQAARVLGAGGLADGSGKETVRIVAIGTSAAIPALHAAALEPGLVGELVLKRALDSWARIVDSPTAGRQLPNLVHAALAAYDLPDLRTVLGSRITVEEPVGADDRVLPAAR